MNQVSWGVNQVYHFVSLFVFVWQWEVMKVSRNDSLNDTLNDTFNETFNGTLNDILNGTINAHRRCIGGQLQGSRLSLASFSQALFWLKWPEKLAFFTCGGVDWLMKPYLPSLLHPTPRSGWRCRV